jgi:hypothetical protein
LSPAEYQKLTRGDKQAINDYRVEVEMKRRAGRSEEQVAREQSVQEQARIDHQDLMRKMYPGWDDMSEETRKYVALRPFIQGIASQSKSALGRALIEGAADPVIANGFNAIARFLTQGIPAALTGDWAGLAQAVVGPLVQVMTETRGRLSPEAQIARDMANAVSAGDMGKVVQIAQSARSKPLEASIPVAMEGIASIAASNAEKMIGKGINPEMKQIFRNYESRRKAAWAEVLRERELAGKGVLADIYKFFTGKYAGERPVEKALKEYGEKTIRAITLYRQPIRGALQQVVNWITAGSLEKEMKGKAYDRLFHLSMLLEFTDGTSLTIEKNAAIKITKGKLTYTVEAQALPVAVSKPITFRELIFNGVKKAGAESFFVYDAFTNNCQKFLADILSANGLYTAREQTFVRQDVAGVARGHPLTSKILGGITDVAGIVGGGVGASLVMVERADDGKHKWVATFSDGTKTPFGDRRYEDYTQHGDKKRRTAYRSRHKKDLETKDPRRAGFLSYYILWGESTDLADNVMAYDRMVGGNIAADLATEAVDFAASAASGPVGLAGYVAKKVLEVGTKLYADEKEKNRIIQAAGGKQGIAEFRRLKEADPTLAVDDFVTQKYTERGYTYSRGAWRKPSKQTPEVRRPRK